MNATSYDGDVNVKKIPNNLLVINYVEITVGLFASHEWLCSGHWDVSPWIPYFPWAWFACMVSFALKYSIRTQKL